MESAGTYGTPLGTSTGYWIVVRYELGERYAAAFEGLEMETKARHAVLTGEIIAAAG